MPFLAKVIAVAQPLSLQVHPGATIAERGHRSENRAGLSRDDPRRNFPDPLAKTEMVFALEPFAAAGDAHVRVRGSGQLLRVSTGRAG